MACTTNAIPKDFSCPRSCVRRRGEGRYHCCVRAWTTLDSCSQGSLGTSVKDSYLYEDRGREEERTKGGE